MVKSNEEKPSLIASIDIIRKQEDRFYLIKTANGEIEKAKILQCTSLLALKLGSTKLCCFLPEKRLLLQSDTFELVVILRAASLAESEGGNKADGSANSGSSPVEASGLFCSGSAHKADSLSFGQGQSTIGKGLACTLRGTGALAELNTVGVFVASWHSEVEHVKAVKTEVESLHGA